MEMEWVVGIILSIIAIVIGLSLLPVVLQATSNAVNSTSNTTYETLINIIPLIFIAGLVIAVVYMFIRH
jgi:hypothetical protein